MAIQAALSCRFTMHSIKARSNITSAGMSKAALFSAIGYARASGRTGVCMATSGPGATNLITSLADALLDSVPVVAITGQVSQAVAGTDAFQEVDVLGLSLTVTKHSFLVKDVADLADTLRQAFVLAQSGRPGPVLVDIPKDVQLAAVEYQAPRQLTAVTNQTSQLPEQQLQLARTLLSQASKPIAYIGGGVHMAGCFNRAERLFNPNRHPQCHHAQSHGLGGPGQSLLFKYAWHAWYSGGEFSGAAH